MISYSIGIFSSAKSIDRSDTIVSTMKRLLLAPSNDTSRASLPTLCVVARIYWKQLAYFPVFALSLYHAGFHNIRIYLVNTDNRTNIKELEQVIQFVNDLVSQKDFLTLLSLGSYNNTKDYGYGLTDRALTYLYDQYKYSPSICEYVTLTNADNLHNKSFMKKILPHMKAGKDLIAWGFVSRYRWAHRIEVDRKNKTIPELWDDGTDKCLPAVLKRRAIDLSAVAYKLSFLEREKLYFVPLEKRNLYYADGKFAEEASKRTNASVLLKQTLVFHQ